MTWADLFTSVSLSLLIHKTELSPTSGGWKHNKSRYSELAGMVWPVNGLRFLWPFTMSEGKVEKRAREAGDW